jgi:hypothetical protein
MKCLSLVLLIGIGLPFSSFAQTKDTIRVMVYNLLNFPDGSNSCTNNTTTVSRVDTLKKIIDYVEPDVLMVCEVQYGLATNSILNDALNANGRTGYQMATYVPNNSGGTSLNNAFFYNTDKLGFTRQKVILTDLRDISVYQMHGINPNSSGGQANLDFMVGHLKASNTVADEQRRARACDSIRKYVDAFPGAQNIILGGDFNFYSGAEAGFQKLTSGLYPFRDPINAPSNWTGNPAWNFIHTQSTRSGDRIDCGATGGMDDRFDMFLTSDPIIQGTNSVRYLPGSYDVVGNNGTTWNRNINDFRNTSPEPQAILDALYYMSDHLPVVMDVEITHPSTVLVKQIDDIDLKLVTFPNPATEQLNLAYELESMTSVDIQVVNLLGQVVAHYPKDKQIGKQQNNIDIANLEKGLYTLIVRTETSQQEQTFIKK